MENLLLSGLYGIYQRWPYYQVMISVKEIVKNLGTDIAPNHRIKTTDEVEIIYSQTGVSNLLQRALDDRRLEPIRKYLNEQPEAYINNLTVAIYGGNPEWIPIDINRSSLREELPDDDFEDINDSLGLVKLRGDETLFVLDGQHRLKGLRLAYEQDNSIGENQITLTLITHIDDLEGKMKTRRLFSVINRHAKPVSLGENILLDEDDLSAILVRKLIEEYPRFINKEIIALNKTADLKMPTDRHKFSSVIALYNINEILIKPGDVYPKYIGSKNNLVRIRPSDEIIEQYRTIVFNFWDKFFECFTNADNFVLNANDNQRNGVGAFSLRPIGQHIFTEYYVKMKKLNRLQDLNIISIIPDDLSNQFWRNVLYDGERIISNKSYARSYVYYHLNLPLTDNEYNTLVRNYRRYNQDEEINLPERLIAQ